MARRIVLTALAMLFAVLPAAAQDVLQRARAAATRADGLALLETHLAASPEDVDARTLYGLMLSWEGRYDEARRELQRVLETAPGYIDARAGLMNVEWWTGRYDDARAHSDAILLREPGHPAARLVRQRVAARDRPWTAGLAVVVDTFNGDRSSWHEELLTVTRQTGAGAILVRAARASRFDLDDTQVEIEFYPVFRPGTYALVAAGAAPDHALYPSNRLALELYQALGGGFEASAGYRRLAFDDAVGVYGASLAKYAGHWLLTARVNYVDAAGGETSAHLTGRRYFGADGTSFAGAGYSRGVSREQIRAEGDLIGEDTNTLRGEISAMVTPRVRLSLDARTSRASRADRARWQHTFGAGLSVRF